MKKILFAIAVGLIFLSSCGGVKTSASGLEKESFLEFIGNPSNYSGGVEESVDNNTTFIAEVYNDHSNRLKGKVYAISTGQHIVTVNYKNKVILKKQIFLSSQETSKVLLP